MTSFAKRSRYAFGVVATAAVIILSGCTDGITGPDDAATNARLLEASPGATVEHADPLGTPGQPDVQGRLAHRYSLPAPPPGGWPLPDSAGTSPPPPYPPVPPVSRVAGRYSPIQLPPDTSSTPLPNIPTPPGTPPAGSGGGSGGSN